MDNSILNLKKCVYKAIRETEKKNEKLLFFVIKSNYVITEKKG